LLWLLIRSLPNERLQTLRRARRWAPVDWALRRGELQALGGMVPRLRLSAAYFDYSGVIAYPVLMGSHEPMVQEALRRTVWPGSVVLDLGASIGPFSLLAAWLVGPKGQVISVEPQLEYVRAIRANALANGFRNIRVLHAAAGSQRGDMDVLITEEPMWTLMSNIGEHALERARQRVSVVAIDELVEGGEIPVPDVIKIDVEGSEIEVLKGMSNLLSQRRPIIIAEMHDKNAEFCRVMAEYRYDTTNLDGPEPVEEAGPSVHVLCSPQIGVVEREGLLRTIYDAFNARDIDAFLRHTTVDVDWPNAWEGGRVVGHEGVRDYWTRQWSAIDPAVTPITFTTRSDGRVAVEVEQIVRSLEGAIVGQGRVLHIYTFRDGLVARMDVADLAGTA
jgi:FkbM family methyltransferase